MKKFWKSIAQTRSHWACQFVYRCFRKTTG